jgi:probable F420-dependent oxidoreductase
MADITVSVAAAPADLGTWLELARRVEAAGFHGLVMGDHPGSGLSPWPALGCAAAVTSTLELGTCVVQAGVREPMQVVAEAATLSVLAPGRVVLGIGAGHTPREWADVGRQRPGPAERAARLTEFAEVTARLLAGETVTHASRWLSLTDSRLEGFPPAADGVRLMIGGGHPELLRCAGRLADVVGLAGLGRTLEDGHSHEARWSADVLRGQLDLVAEAARDAGRSPALEALVQAVVVTQDRPAVIGELEAKFDVPASDLAATPYLLVGSHEQIAAQLRDQAGLLGITRYVVREEAIPQMERVLGLLSEQ